MKKNSLISKFLFASGLLASCFFTNCNEIKRVAGKPYELVILHTNDLHGQVTPTSDGKGGYASQSTFIKQVREKNKNVLLLCCGDINNGTAISNMFDAKPDILSMNAMNYDAFTFGSHEFLGSLEKVENQIALSKFEWLSANIRIEKDGKEQFFTKPYMIKDFEGFRVAVIGITTRRVPDISTPDKSLSFDNEIGSTIETVKYVKEKEKADIVILLAYMGDKKNSSKYITSIELAKRITDVDLIIDGQNHHLFEKPKYANGIPVVSAGEKGKYVGESHLTIVDGKVTNLEWKSNEITSKKYPADPEIETILKPYIDSANRLLKEVVVNAKDEFEFGNKLSRYKETAVCDLLTDSLIWYLEDKGIHADFAILNTGIIRTGLPKGNITRGQIKAMIPFENYITVVNLRGDEVVNLFKYIGTIKQGSGGWASISKEVSYSIFYDENGNGEIRDVLINNKPIDLDETYTIATNDYLASGGDGYSALDNSNDKSETSVLLSDVFIDYVKELGTIENKIDNRIKIVGGKLPE